MTRVAFVFVSAVLGMTTSVLTFQGRPGGQGAGRGAALQGPNAIVGRVTGNAGQPVAGVFVTALRPSTSSERPFTFVSALLHVQTDVRGEYRLDGLSVGDYFIVALPWTEPGSSPQPARTGYGKTFFPGTADVASAGKVHVNGVEPARADVTLAAARLGVVSGVVIASDGQPVQGGVLQLARGDSLFGLDAHAYRLAANGTFAIPSVPPGTYFLVFHESAWPPGRGNIPAVSQTKVVVTGDDVSGVRVRPIHMVQASGRIVMDAAARASADLPHISVGASPINFDGNPGPQQPGGLQPDLTFTFKTWPSQGRVRVSPEELWAIKSIRLKSVDITGAPLDFIEGKDITGLEVEVVRRTAGRGGTIR